MSVYLCTFAFTHTKTQICECVAFILSTSHTEDELSLKHGDRVHICRSEGDGWVLVRKVQIRHITTSFDAKIEFHHHCHSRRLAWVFGEKL